MDDITLKGVDLGEGEPAREEQRIEASW